MNLKNNLYTDTGWEIAESVFNPDQVATTGSNFMIGNGYLGYRGTLVEWEADRYTACIVSDTYDKADGFPELCNVPNGLLTQLFVDGEMVSVFTGETHDYARGLDLRSGRFFRAQTWEGTHGQRVHLETERLASYDNLHLIAMRYRFRVAQPSQVVISTGIDGEVWNLNGEHFRTYAPSVQGDLLLFETVTGELGTQIDVAEGMTLTGAQPQTLEIVEERKRIVRRLTFTLERGQTITMEKAIAIATSNDVSAPREHAQAEARAALRDGYDVVKTKHSREWERIWDVSDIQIEGDLEDQIATRFSLYQNIIATPTHARLPIGARGLSCQVYQGAAFWDQEIFNLPMFLYTRPRIAKSILRYRYDTLDGAREKAERLGFGGAFYAWTSGKTGEELFPDFFFTDVLTGRKIRNHFNDWQIHISPDIVTSIWQYYVATGDWDFIVKHGAEIAFEVAQFLVSRSHYRVDKGRYELIRVLGPDEYHENVDNNAFTNYQAHFALEKALTIREMMKESAAGELEALFARLDLTETDVENWKDIAERIYLPQPDRETLLVEQFEGYFQLEDVRPDEVRQRLLDPEEYWGWPNGVAVRTQVLKQADLLQLFALHDRLFPKDVMRANYDYYEPRTEHGSSLSPSVHSLVASRVGRPGRAYEYFKKGSTIDLYDASTKVMSGGTFLGGIHTAACGGVWQMIVQGFGGLQVDQGGIRLAPALPDHWERVVFHLVIRNNLLAIELREDEVRVRATQENGGSVRVTVGEKMQVLSGGDRATVAL